MQRKEYMKVDENEQNKNNLTAITATNDLRITFTASATTQQSSLIKESVKAKRYL